MQPRQYQTTAVDAIVIGKTNLICLPMRAGKSAVMKFAIDKHQFSRVLIIVGYRKIVKQLSSYYPDRYTYILSGEPFDHSKQIHIATHQTFNNRDICPSEYDCIIIDEFHSRMSAAVYALLDNSATHLLFTGTPLTPKNKIITKGIDNFIQPVTVKDLLEAKYLAPTKFMSNSDILGRHAQELLTTKQDFDQSIVRQIIKTEDLLGNIRKLIIEQQLDTKHNTVIYVNYIETAEQLFALLSDLNNVQLVHSNLPDKQQSQALVDYESNPGILINVRALSLGWDSPRTDRLIYAFFTKIHSLALQILWRASTINPSDPTKIATVYDMTGQLGFVNPYTDFSSYSKKKSCKDQCYEQYGSDPMQLYFCLESCHGEPIVVTCDGKQPFHHNENPFITNYRVIEGTPCKQPYPSWEFQYRTIDAGLGLVTKYQKCPCGCVTAYDVKTLHQPSDMIPVYDEHKIMNTVTILFSKERMRALALFDDISKSTYKILQFDSSESLYIEACKFFNSKQFQIVSNARLPKLPNVFVNNQLNAVLPLIVWDTPNANFIKKLIKFKLEQLCEYFGVKPGMIYYVSKYIQRDNEKQILNDIGGGTFDRASFIKYCKNLQKD